MRILCFFSLIFFSSTAIAADQCHYDGATYHDGDWFLAKDQCNSCYCKITDEGPEVGCQEIGCIVPDHELKKDFSKFKWSQSIYCQKYNRKLDVKWEILIEDLNRDGEFVLNATRNGQAYYHRHASDRYVTLTKKVLNNKIVFTSPRGTVSIDLTRPYGGERTTGYFSTQRYNKQVSNLTCKHF